MRHTPYKWLNLQYYFTQIIPHLRVVKIKYFTAIIVGDHLPNQMAFLAAVRTLPLVEIFLGKFQKNKRRCEYKGCTMTVPPNRRFTTREEKRTDVNIGVHMVDDAYQNACDHQVLITGDSDLVPALNTIRHRFPNVTLTVFVPARDASRAKATDLKLAVHNFYLLPQHLLASAQFPATFKDAYGTQITKPADW